MRILLQAFLILSVAATCVAQGPSLENVRFWAYQIQGQNLNNSIQKLADSRYDLLVIDNVRSVKGDEDYDNAADVAKLKKSLGSRGRKKIVVCYIDIGEAEEYRYYWKPGWKIGNPEWITGDDPDGWEENYPVKYWRQEWKDIVFGNDSAMVDRILVDGYDGIYLDWVEAYEFEPVDSAAVAEGLDAREEMIAFIIEIAKYCRSKKPGFLVIPQNATYIVLPEDSLAYTYLATIDAIAQEDIWFDGEADPNGREGDVPVDQELTREYIANLEIFQNAGLPVFTVDYASKPVNVDSSYRAAARLGYVEYVSLRQLNRLTDTPPPGLVTGVGEEFLAPGAVRLFQNYPNPFSVSTTISFSLPSTMKVRFALVDASGKEVMLLFKGLAGAGEHEVRFVPRDIVPGIYFYYLQAGATSRARPMIYSP